MARYVTISGLRVRVGSYLYRYYVAFNKALAEAKAADARDKRRKRRKPAPAPAPTPIPPEPVRPVVVSIRVQALHRLKAKLGTKESPPDSNHCWATAWYGSVGPWCAMSVSWAYATSSSKRFARGIRYAYVPYIVRDARNNVNGLSVVINPVPGDLVTYDWEKDGVPDHVGLFERWIVKGKTFYAIEGNTAVGNDSNGGEVMRRERDVSLVCHFVHVTEPV